MSSHCFRFFLVFLVRVRREHAGTAAVLCTPLARPIPLADHAPLAVADALRSCIKWLGQSAEPLLVAPLQTALFKLFACAGVTGAARIQARGQSTVNDCIAANGEHAFF